MAKARAAAAANADRSRIPPSSIAIHLCIGSVYAWSIYSPALTRVLGVVAPAADDWSLRDVTWVFSVAIVFLGLSAAFAGRWVEAVGPRRAGIVAALCWGGGHLVGGAGIHMHQLWLLYLGYGVIGGCGLGLGYVTPMGSLIRRFPERRGMAAGLAIMGFGGGALLAAPVKRFLLQFFYTSPEFMGPASQVALITEGGRRFTERAGQMAEVVVVGANDVASMLVPGPQGVYVVGTGSVGAFPTFVTLGLLLFAVMMVAAYSYPAPAPAVPPHIPAQDDAAVGAVSSQGADTGAALRTPQFRRLWLALCMIAAAGIALLSVAGTMLSEIFGNTLPDIVSGTFAALYVSMICAFYMFGRYFWTSLSGRLGRKAAYSMLFGLGIGLFCSIPYVARQMSAAPSMVWLAYFCAATLLIVGLYGGGFAAMPAYLADIFGTRHLGGMHRRLFTAWSVAGVLGPLALTSLRESAVERAIANLVQLVDPQAFHAHFGAPLEHLAELVDARTVSIGRLMEIVPPGTLDPTPNLYNGTMYLMATLLAIGLLCNVLMKPASSPRAVSE